MRRRISRRQPVVLPATDPVVGTRGRALDHIGFEVKGLEAFCRKLESLGIKLDRPYTKVPALNIAIAFIYRSISPWSISSSPKDSTRFNRSHALAMLAADMAMRLRTVLRA